MSEGLYLAVVVCGVVIGLELALLLALSGVHLVGRLLGLDRDREERAYQLGRREAEAEQRIRRACDLVDRLGGSRF